MVCKCLLRIELLIYKVGRLIGDFAYKLTQDYAHIIDKVTQTRKLRGKIPYDYYIKPVAHETKIE